MENGVRKMEIWRSVCVNLRCILNFFGFFALNLKCVLNFFGFFCFMKHEKRIVKTEFAWIFRLFTKGSK